jgi:hypothetical protein
VTAVHSERAPTRASRNDSRRSWFVGLNATHVIASTVGVFFGLFSGVNHGLFELLQGNTPTNGFLIHAIGDAQRFWSLGTEDAFTLIPNFAFTGVASIVVGAVAAFWSLRCLASRHGRSIFLGLFVLLFLVGGGVGQVFFFIPAWAFATRIGKPLTGWSRVLPPGIRPLLSRLWIVTLALTIVSMLIALEVAIFGFFPGLTDPVRVNGAALFFVSSASILCVVSFVAGFGHDLRRRTVREQGDSEAEERPAQ